MGYLFLAIALLTGKIKGYCGKKTSDYTKDFHDAILANVIRMLLCVVIGFIWVLASEGIGNLRPTPELLWISAFSGITTSIFVVTWLVCVKKSAYMMLDVFLMLGVLIPLIASKLFFSEAIKLTQWIGVFVLFVAVLIMCSYNNSIKTKITPAALLLLLICGITSGMADFSQKLFMKQVVGGSVGAFNFYTYIFSSLTLFASLLVIRRNRTAKTQADFRKISGYILIMAICLFLNSYFKTLAAGRLSAVLLYPLNQGCSLILSAAMSKVFFKEKVTPKAVVGLVIAFVGLIIINLL